MAKNKEGMNVKVSLTGYEKVKEFCKKNGMLIGAFFETAALDKIKKLELKKE